MKNIIILIILIFAVTAPIYLVLAEGDSVSLNNPVQGAASGEEAFTQLFSRIIQFILGIIGATALIMFVYGGITMVTSAGDSAKATKGKEIITWAIIGLIVILASYGLVSFVITSLTK